MIRDKNISKKKFILTKKNQDYHCKRIHFSTNTFFKRVFSRVFSRDFMNIEKNPKT